MIIFGICRFCFRKGFQMVREGTVVTGGGNAILEIWFLKSKSSKHYHRMLSDPTFPNSFKNHHIFFLFHNFKSIEKSL